MPKKTSIIIQARTGSHRLPKKVLASIEKKPMIWYVINRLKKVNEIDQIILATTKKKEDEKLIQIANNCDIEIFQGKANDVLDRYYNCSLKFNADPIIRITADCPLIDYVIINKMLKIFKLNKFDYICNNLPPTFPDGLDVEIFSFKSLKKSFEKAELKSEREHVTPFIRKNKNNFKIYNYENRKDLSKYRFTVDEKEDLKFIRKIFAKFPPQTNIVLKDILKVLDKNPELLKINNRIIRNEGYLKSLKKDIRSKI